MEDPIRVRKIVSSARQNTTLPLTAKIRLGETLDEDKLRNFCLMLAGEGIDLETPAMDSIAARGVRFTRFYSAAPVCSPSRAGLLTGRYPLRAGLMGNASSRQGDPGMPPQATLAKMFKAAGYATAHIGKWHLGFTPETMPNGQGFDYSFGHMGGCIDNLSHFFYWDGPNRHDRSPLSRARRPPRGRTSAATGNEG